jgi:hypothetical protein
MKRDALRRDAILRDTVKRGVFLPSCPRRGGTEGDGVVGVAGDWRLAAVAHSPG